MRTIHTYIVKQVIKNLIMTVFVLTMLFLIGNALKDVMLLVSSHQVPISVVAKSIFYLLPFVMVYVLPIAFLTSTLLVFGRLSADQELTAMRASGISLVSIIYPVIILSLFFSFGCAWINLDLGPKGRVAFKKLLFEAGQQDLKNSIPEGRFITDFPGNVLYVGKVGEASLSNVLFYQLKEGRKVLDVRASKAEIIDDPSSDFFVIRFINPTIFRRQGNDYISISTFQSDPKQMGSDGSGESEASFEKWYPVMTDEMEISFPRPSVDTFRKIKLSEMTYHQLVNEYKTLKASGMSKADLIPVKMHLHEKSSFSFASLGFTLLGIPLGIQAHRRDTSSGVVIALGMMLLYYGILIAAKSMEGQTQIAPHLLLWVPNLLFQFLGVFLILRKNKH